MRLYADGEFFSLRREHDASLVVVTHMSGYERFAAAVENRHLKWKLR
jgi:hypothetical protein